MQQLKNEREVHETVGAMLSSIAAAPGFESWLREIDQTWCFSLRQPDAQVTCAFTADETLQVDLGPSQLAPDVIISMTATDAHRYLLGELNVFLELDQGTMSITGPADEFLRTIPRFRGLLAPVYRQMLRGQDRQNLLPNP